MGHDPESRSTGRDRSTKQKASPQGEAQAEIRVKAEFSPKPGECMPNKQLFLTKTILQLLLQIRIRWCHDILVVSVL